MNATPPGLTPADAERLEDLLADRAVFGLDPTEAAELADLLAASGRSDNDSLDLLASEVATGTPAEPLPAALRERVLDDHADWQEASRSTPAAGPVVPGNRDWPIYTMLAVAAGVLISMNLNLFGGVPSLTDQRARLIARADDLVQVAWAPQEDASLDELEGDGAYGDVVWSDASQSGYMRFRGLRANDPSVEQYQLWVFDEARSADRPVDGGVFDIVPGEDGEAIVPIDAKLPVTRATLFAITVEKPGGVVVSDRSRLPLLAQR